MLNFKVSTQHSETLWGAILNSQNVPLLLDACHYSIGQPCFQFFVFQTIAIEAPDRHQCSKSARNVSIVSSLLVATHIYFPRQHKWVVRVRRANPPLTTCESNCD